MIEDGPLVVVCEKVAARAGYAEQYDRDALKENRFHGHSRAPDESERSSIRFTR